MNAPYDISFRNGQQINSAGKAQKLDEEDIDLLLRKAARNPAKGYRAIALKVPPGAKLIGPSQFFGTRSDDPNDIATPDGAKGGRRIANGPLPNGLAGALIGRIGPNGTPFGIGNMNSISAPASGVLYLGINDNGFGDNKGNFQVVVR